MTPYHDEKNEKQTCMIKYWFCETVYVAMISIYLFFPLSLKKRFAKMTMTQCDPLSDKREERKPKACESQNEIKWNPWQSMPE
jgi:hypothetical protein